MARLIPKPCPESVTTARPSNTAVRFFCGSLDVRRAHSPFQRGGQFADTEICHRPLIGGAENHSCNLLSGRAWAPRSMACPRAGHVQAWKPILTLSTALATTFSISTLLRDGHPVELINLVCSDMSNSIVMEVLRSCLPENGTTIEGSVCDRAVECRGTTLCRADGVFRGSTLPKLAAEQELVEASVLASPKDARVAQGSAMFDPCLASLPSGECPFEADRSIQLGPGRSLRCVALSEVMQGDASQGTDYRIASGGSTACRRT